MSSITWKELKGVDSLIDLIVVKCVCGNHMAFDSTYRDQVGDIISMCHACSREIIIKQKEDAPTDVETQFHLVMNAVCDDDVRKERALRHALHEYYYSMSMEANPQAIFNTIGGILAGEQWDELLQLYEQIH